MPKINSNNNKSSDSPVRQQPGSALQVPVQAVLLAAVLLLQSACATRPADVGKNDTATQTIRENPVPDKARPLPAASASVAAQTPAAQTAATSNGINNFYKSSSGEFISPPEVTSKEFSSGDVTLNFENTSLQEVIKVILGDLLGENYVVDPRVKGNVTLQTSRPFGSSALLPVLELLLANNGAALIHNRGIYRVVPQEDALRVGAAPQVGDAAPLPAGYQVRIVPLQYVAAEEMKKILTPLSQEKNIVSVDSQRNLMILAGTPNELERLLQTVGMFDVDWLEGMSFALFTPSFVDAKTLVTELKNIFDEDKALAGLVRIVPIERLNALLVVTSRASYLQKVKEWVDRLDLETAGSGRRLFIYHVQNGKATELADVLAKIFDQPASRSVSQPALAPGLQPAEIRSPDEAADGQTDTAISGNLGRPSARSSSSVEDGLTLEDNTAIRIIADEVNNTLLILATAHEYRMVQAALAKMDIIPLQVLIEATIAEITLTDDLQYGLQWYFKNNAGKYPGAGVLDLGSNLVGQALAIPPVANSFSYAITSAGAVRAVLTALATESKVDIISSPSIMVLNNQKASIQVGDQIPIETQAQTTVGGTLLNSFQYRDTGILLTVTPRVNAGGLITMEIEQEASNVGATPAGSTNPIISQRKIQSVVAVKSGETVVLGGLITERKEDTRRGVPVLHTLPIIGRLFGETVDNNSRTELVVLLTPRAVNNAADAQAVTDEFRKKMQGLKPFQPNARKREYRGLLMEQSIQSRE